MIAILLASAAAAQGQALPSEGMVLWNNIRAGISKAEFKALWPKRTTALADGCFADVGADFNRGKLETVKLEWSANDTNKRCADVVSASLHGKYGEPVALASDVELRDCGNEYASGLAGALAGLCKSLGGEEPKTSRLYRWVRDGIEITFKRSGDNESEWYLVYRAAVSSSEGVQDKL